MKSVEGRELAFPPVYWADEIVVEEDDGVINVRGLKTLPSSAGARQGDLLGGHFDGIANVNGKGGKESPSPHIVFANCLEDEALLYTRQSPNESPKMQAKLLGAQGAALAKWTANLKRYVSRYGPVLAESASIQVCAAPGGVRIEAQQRWDVLRREQQTLYAVMRIFEQTQSTVPSHQELLRAVRKAVSGTAHWIVACEESVTRRDQGWQPSPSWRWAAKDQYRAQCFATSVRSVDTGARLKCPECAAVIPLPTHPMSPFLACRCGFQLDVALAAKENLSQEIPCPDWAIANARRLLCHILDAFPAKLTDYNGNPFEMPPEDVSAGILPVLYQLIRRDYLSQAKVARCAWKECTKWFRVGAHNSPCCSPEHSLKYRQSKYYQRWKSS